MASGDGISLIELVVLGWSSATAAPAPIPIRIDFDAPADCSTADEFYEGLRARSDRVRLATDGEDGWGVRVRLSRGGAGVHGELRVVHAGGETDTRIVDATSCDVVVQALSLTAALSLDEVVEVTAPLAPPAPPPPAVPPAPPPAPREAPSLKFALGAHVVVTQVIAPHASLGAALGARVTPHVEGPLSPSFGLSLMYARNDLLSGGDSVLIQWAAAALSACPVRWQLGPIVSAEPCVVAAGGWLAAAGRGISNPESVVRSWWSAGGFARAAALLGGGTALELEAGVLVPLVHRRFTMGWSAETVGETPVISPLVGVGIVHNF
ncbi:hypothetical protein WMF27_27350 [Sorangium sp. So ce281]|uniref:hypothetical protein n=1 Tax=unclassified Sorangium TaxID=2621164 RepID=UPI003F60B754